MRKAPSLVLLFAWAFGAGLVQAETPGSMAAKGTCPAGTNYEQQRYAVDKVELVTPFDVLHLGFLSQITRSIFAGLAALEHAPFNYRNVERMRRQIEDNQLGDSSGRIPVTGSLVLVYAENCRTVENANVLDLEYWYMPVRVPSFWSHSFESQKQEAEEPAKASGIASSKFVLSPLAGYSATSKAFGGASVRTVLPLSFLNTFTAEALGSSRRKMATMSLSGDSEPSREWMQRSQWTFEYRFEDEPLLAGQIKKAQIAAEWKNITRPISGSGWVFRYGTGLEGGYRQATAGSLPEGAASMPALINTGLGGLKVFGGATNRTVHHSFELSYGVLLARGGNGGLIDFHKHIVDAAHSWRLVRNHYPLEIDSRLNAGVIKTGCAAPAVCGVPLAEQFFGGNVEHNFLTDNSWIIRSQPFIRSLPLNGLTANGSAGANRFVSLNLTIGQAVYRKTLIPEELLTQPQFLQRVDATPETAKLLLASAYANLDESLANDPGLEKARPEIQSIKNELDRVRPIWDSLEMDLPSERGEEYEICTQDHLDGLLLDIEEVESRTKPVQLLAYRTSHAAEAAKCLLAFSRTAGDDLSLAGARIEQHRMSIESVVQSTDTWKRALRRANEDVALGQRTIHTLFHEVNLFSVSPVLVFDIAATAAPSMPFTKNYGIGGGARVTLASTVRFTAGYAANVWRRQPHDSKGALFASLELLDIFR